MLHVCLQSVWVHVTLALLIPTSPLSSPQACDKYECAVQLNWDSPQALNNWGLALQELGTIVPAREKRVVIRKAINKVGTTR